MKFTVDMVLFDTLKCSFFGINRWNFAKLVIDFPILKILLKISEYQLCSESVMTMVMMMMMMMIIIII